MHTAVALELVAGSVSAFPKPVQRLVVAATMPARVHAACVRDHGRLHRARIYHVCDLAGAATAPDRLWSPFSGIKLYATLTEREGQRAGLKSPGNPRLGLLSRQPDASSWLRRLQPYPARSRAHMEGGWVLVGANKYCPAAQAPARDSWHDLVSHSSLGETLNRPRDPVPRRPLRLDSDILAGRQPTRRARAPADA